MLSWLSRNSIPISFVRISSLSFILVSVHTTLLNSMSSSKPCGSLKSLSNKVRGMLRCCGSPSKYTKLDSKLEQKMIEARKSSLGHQSFKSINGIIMRFPQLREGLKNIRDVFQHYDQDSNETIDRDELRKCLEDLNVCLSEEEVEDLFRSCNINRSQGIQFNEFIVLLCLIYFLSKTSASSNTVLKMGSPELKATFEAIVEAFMFLDKNGDGKLNKDDIISALNDPSPWEKSPAHVTKTRFKEMDWDKRGKVSFRNFLFAFIGWVGFEGDQEEATRN